MPHLAGFRRLLDLGIKHLVGDERQQHEAEHRGNDGCKKPTAPAHLDMQHVLGKRGAQRVGSHAGHEHRAGDRGEMEAREVQELADLLLGGAGFAAEHGADRLGNRQNDAARASRDARHGRRHQQVGDAKGIGNAE